MRESEATRVAAASKKHGGSEETIDPWKKKLAGMGPTDVKPLKELEQDVTFSAAHILPAQQC